MRLKEQNHFSNLNKVKKCQMHGIFYKGICPLCDEEIQINIQEPI